MNKFFFPLNDGYYYGRRLHGELKDKLGNKLVQNSHATGLLCQAVRNAGDGDYIEIGSLYGGSAITAALTKKEFKLDGRIKCVEPSPRNILENAKLFGVDGCIDIFKFPSNELYLIREDVNISCGFIDGDHRPPHPQYDWAKLSHVSNRYVIFDDVDKSEPGVVGAFYTALEYTDWNLVHFSDAIAIFERRK
jgi:predicted O-methyltransferase YrrM